MNKFALCILPAFLLITFFTASATVQNFSTDKPMYYEGDSIIVSGKVDYDSAIPSIILQIITPDGSGLAHIANIVPKSNGSFSKTIIAGGPTWNLDGAYTIKISYGGNFEQTIDYKKSSQPNNPDTNEPSPDPSPVDKPEISAKSSETPTVEPNIFLENPKMRLLGFPSYEKSPQYYIDRYNNEQDYQDWFDSQFPSYTIDDVVGYGTTHIENFPSYEKSPQYYIDRYNNEQDYQDWFDSQFPGKSIYDVLGFSTYIPDWIKTYANNWATGKLSDHEFMTGIDFMIHNRIIVIPTLDYSAGYSIDDVPSWFRNTAQWWSNDLISQQEFINSLKYLIQTDIILIE